MDVMTYSCWNCGTQYYNAFDLCPACNATFKDIDDTMHIDRDELNKLIQSHQQTGTGILHEGFLLVLDFDDKQLAIPLRNKVLIGRDIPTLGETDSVDLNDFLGFQAGVSRRHAEIKRTKENRLILTDLASANGTFVNGKRLTALQSYMIKNGDEVFFGHLGLTLFYETDTA